MPGLKLTSHGQLYLYQSIVMSTLDYWIDVSDYDYWRSTPNFHKPWFINPGLTLFNNYPSPVMSP